MTKQNRRTSDDSWFLIAIICRETSKIDMQMNKKKEKNMLCWAKKREFLQCERPTKDQWHISSLILFIEHTGNTVTKHAISFFV